MSHTARTQAAVPDVAHRPEPPEADRRPSPTTSPWQFPGCRPIHISRDDVADYDGRFEFWDAELETAWVMEPNSPYHESPSQILAALVDRIAAVRGLAHPLLRDDGPCCCATSTARAGASSRRIRRSICFRRRRTCRGSRRW